MKKLFLVLVAHFFFLPVMASVPKISKLGVGYGILNSGIFTELNDDGDTSAFGTFELHFLDLSANFFHKRTNLNYLVKAAYTVLPREAADGAVDVTRWRLSFLVGKTPPRYNSRFLFAGGIGVLGASSKGNGGSLVLNNGSGTSTFYRPSDSSSSRLLMLEGGVTYYFHPRFKVGMELLVNGLLSPKRNFNVFTTISWYINKGRSQARRKGSKSRGRRRGIRSRRRY